MPPPHKLSVCPPQKKIMHICFNLLISRVLILCASTKIMLMFLKICFKICLFDCFYAFVNGCASPPPPPPPAPDSDDLFFLSFLLVSLFRRKMRIFFLGGGGEGGCQLKMLVPPYENPRPPVPPSPRWKKS